MWPCPRPPEARAGKGLSTTHCRYHVQLRSRHGSYWKRTILTATLRPYRQAAERYLKVHADDLWLSDARKRLEAQLDGAGRWRHAVEVKSRFLSAQEKARASLARLREAEVPPARLLVAYLAVAGAIAEDPIGPGGEPGEYRRVQAAKAVFRLASGYHSGHGYDRYPRSAGRVLRVLGSMLEEACAEACEQHLAAILQVKAGGKVEALRVLCSEPTPPDPPFSPEELATLYP